MASQPVMEAAKRESRANAREDMAVLTSGAREKVDGTMASVQAFGQTLLHPMDKKKKEEIQAAAEQQKQGARDKRDEIRSIAAQQGTTERAAARGLVAKGVAETGGTRYPVVSPDQPQESTGPDGDAASNNETPNHPPVGTPNHPPVIDEPFYDRSDVLHAEDQPAGTHKEPHNENIVSEGSGTHTNAPKPVDGLSRESKSGEFVEDADTKGVEDADFYPEPRIVKT